MELVTSREDRRLMRRRGAGAREMKDRQFGFVLESLPESLTESGCATEEAIRPIAAREEQTAPDTTLPKRKKATGTGTRKRKALDDIPTTSETCSEVMPAARKRSRAVATSTRRAAPPTLPSDSGREPGISTEELGIKPRATIPLTSLNGAASQAETGTVPGTALSRIRTARRSQVIATETETHSKSKLDKNCTGTVEFDGKSPPHKRNQVKKNAVLGATIIEQAGLPDVDDDAHIEREVPRQKPKKPPCAQIRTENNNSESLDNVGFSGHRRTICGGVEPPAKRGRTRMSAKDHVDPNLPVRDESKVGTKGRAIVRIFDEFTTTVPSEGGMTIAESQTNRINEKYNSGLRELSTNITESIPKEGEQISCKRADSAFEKLVVSDSHTSDSKVQQTISGSQLCANSGAKPRGLKPLIKPSKATRPRGGAKARAKARPHIGLQDNVDSSELEDYGEVRVPLSLKPSDALVGRWRL